MEEKKHTRPVGKGNGGVYSRVREKPTTKKIKKKSKNSNNRSKWGQSKNTTNPFRKKAQKKRSKCMHRREFKGKKSGQTK